MRKALVIGIALFLVAISVCLVPHRKGTTTAYQENLWTGGGWGSPAQQTREPDLKHWNRTQYGIKWAWLVVDREVSGEAWSARVEPKAIMIYWIVALGFSIMPKLASSWRKRTAKALPVG